MDFIINKPDKSTPDVGPEVVEWYERTKPTPCDLLYALAWKTQEAKDLTDQLHLAVRFISLEAENHRHNGQPKKAEPMERWVRYVEGLLET